MRDADKFQRVGMTSRSGILSPIRAEQQLETSDAARSLHDCTYTTVQLDLG